MENKNEHKALLIRKKTSNGTKTEYDCVCLDCGMMITLDENEVLNSKKIIKIDKDITEDFSLFFEIRQKYLYYISTGIEEEEIIKKINTEYNEDSTKVLKKK
ncbi:MAG: hypothetical protein IJ097_02200 [Bacilli bacterium]|nr:hypothetical protein [Bacilli bacterium]